LRVGSVPSALCATGISYLDTSDNPGITCYADCLSTVTTNDYSPAEACPPIILFQDVSLCSFIASTNVGSLYTEWECDSDGVLNGDPCQPDAEWTGVTCNSEGYVNSIIFASVELSGSLPNELSSLSTLTLLQLTDADFVGKFILLYVVVVGVIEMLIVIDGCRLYSKYLWYVDEFGGAASFTE